MLMPRTVLACLLAVLLPACSALPAQRDTLFQVATIDALMQGAFDGTTSIRSLLAHGDLGIGTFDALDGEMVVVGGIAYQVKVDGSVHVASGDSSTPFACVTTFEPDQLVTLDHVGSFSELTQRLDSALPSPNLFYAFRIRGRFPHVMTRSVPRQERPFTTLTEAVKQQALFHFSDVEGEIVGFRCPAFVKGINVPGYHMHFLTADRRGGGHVLDCRLENTSVAVDMTDRFTMVLPREGAFTSADLTRDLHADLMRVEQ